MRIGFGNDIHRLEAGRSLILAGIEIPSDLGAVGHSDSDVIFHAVTDAILGALALGDIGSHFPPDDDRWKNAESSIFLKEAVSLMKAQGYTVGNLDTTISLETPKLGLFVNQIRQNISALLEIGISKVSVKAKTGECLDAVGERRAIKAEACVLLEKVSN